MKSAQSAEFRRNLLRGQEAEESAETDLLGASTSQKARNEAIQRVPWKELSSEVRAKIQPVLLEQSLYRRLPQQSVYCDPAMFFFLLNHPDVVVAIWERLGVNQISLKQSDKPGVYNLRETVGSTGTVELIYMSPELSIAYSRGSYRGPLMTKAVEGETVLLVQHRFERDDLGEPYVIAQIDSFIRIHNVALDVFAKLFAPLLGKVADNNFEQAIAFVGNLSTAAQSNPDSVRRLGMKLESIRPEIREQFARAGYQTAQNAIDRMENPLENSPYGRRILASQQELTEKQRLEFEQDRLTYLAKQQEALRANPNAEVPQLVVPELDPEKAAQNQIPSTPTRR
ncbi:MAG: hypothetical protein ACRC10_09395 [Thermoguttaceae bacterium]